MENSTVTQKGQTTIPKSIRQHLGLKPRQRLYYQIKDDEVVLTASQAKVDELFGSLKGVKPAASKAAQRRSASQALANRLA